jgi:MFS family permease
MSYFRTIRQLRREAWIVLGASVAQGLTWSGLSDAVLNLYQVRMGYGPEFVGTSAAVSNLGYAVASIPGAAVSRRLGARRSMLLGSLGWVLGLLLLSVSDFIPAGWQVAWVLAVRMGASAGLALFMVSSQPYMTAVTSDQERPHAFALIIALRPLGAVVGAMAGGLLPSLFAGMGGIFGSSLADARPYGMTLTVGMAIYLPVFWALRRLPRDGPAYVTGGGGAPVPASRVAQEQAWSRARTRSARAPFGILAAIGVVCALRVGGEFTARTFFSVYLDDRWAISAAQIGGAIALSNLISIPAPLITPALVRRWGRVATIASNAVGVALSIVVMGMGGHWLVVSGAFVAMTVFAAMSRSVWSLVIQESVTDSWRPLAAGVANLFSGLGTMAMSSVGGLLAAGIGYGATFLTSAALVGLGAVSVWLAFSGKGAESASRAVSTAVG